MKQKTALSFIKQCQGKWDRDLCNYKSKKEKVQKVLKEVPDELLQNLFQKRDGENMTGLNYCIAHDQSETMKIILEHTCNVYAKNHDINTLAQVFPYAGMLKYNHYILKMLRITSYGSFSQWDDWALDWNHWIKLFEAKTMEFSYRDVNHRIKITYPPQTAFDLLMKQENERSIHEIVEYIYLDCPLLKYSIFYYVFPYVGIVKSDELLQKILFNLRFAFF